MSSQLASNSSKLPPLGPHEISVLIELTLGTCSIIWQMRRMTGMANLDQHKGLYKKGVINCSILFSVIDFFAPYRFAVCWRSTNRIRLY